MTTGWTVWAAIALGSAFGGVMRQALAEMVTVLVGPGFPWGTWLVNVLGSGAIGAVSAAASNGWPSAWAPTARHAVMTGILGGFTTFSTFSVQVFGFCQQGRWGEAAVYALASVAVSVGACWAAVAGMQVLAR